jgi:hypothetical protein
MNETTIRHWADDPYWTEAFEASVRRRQGGRRRRINPRPRRHRACPVRR